MLQYTCHIATGITVFGAVLLAAVRADGLAFLYGFVGLVMALYLFWMGGQR